MKKLRRIFYFGGAFLLLLLKFTFDVVAKNVDLDAGGAYLLRELAVIGAFVLIVLALDRPGERHDVKPVRLLGLLLAGLVVVGVLLWLLMLIGSDGFDAKNRVLIPLDYAALFVAAFSALLLGLYALALLRVLRDLILFQRRRGTLRNFLIFVGLVLAAAVSTAFQRPLERGLLTTILAGMAITFAVVNAFRLPWIVYLLKRDKVITLVVALFLFGGLTILDITLQVSQHLERALLFYSSPLREFVTLILLGGTIFAGMTFVSTLFHLPTADAFDRKRSEVTSLHTLGRLITQVFDFNELVDTVVGMTLQVVEAKSCWLELIHLREDGGGYAIQVAGMRNISREQIEHLLPSDARTVRDMVLEKQTPVVVDDVTADARFRGVKKSALEAGSLVVVPLVSHAGLVGILYATKGTSFGFMKDDLDVVSAFADQATIAIENSRLIKKSLERERLLQEMALAQEMQRKLLPDSLPQYPGIEIEACSTPAFEVGGDYYDAVELGNSTIGVVVGDVSGKGVPAAFYMSEVKGIFQSLSRLHGSPRDFLIRANEVLMRSIDRRSFVSLLYVIVEAATGRLHLSRAGHCPLLLVTSRDARYLRPEGIGLGLSEAGVFDASIEEQTIQLEDGDVCVLYTDGVTEARKGDDEYGYDRLLEAARGLRARSAVEIRDGLLEGVRAFTDGGPNHDDLTVMVLKWHATQRPRAHDVHTGRGQ